LNTGGFPIMLSYTTCSLYTTEKSRKGGSGEERGRTVGGAV